MAFSNFKMTLRNDEFDRIRILRIKNPLYSLAVTLIQLKGGIYRCNHNLTGKGLIGQCVSSRGFTTGWRVLILGRWTVKPLKHISMRTPPFLNYFAEHYYWLYLYIHIFSEGNKGILLPLQQPSTGLRFINCWRALLQYIIAPI